MNIALFLTVFRLCSIPVIALAFLEAHYSAVFFLFVAAGISDILDGYVARRFKQQTKIGAILDPVADKVLIIVILGLLIAKGMVYKWGAFLMIGRDVLLLAGVSYLYHKDHSLPMLPSKISKINTLLQLIWISCILFNLGGMCNFPEAFLNGLFFATLLTTAFSGATYLREFIRVATLKEMR